METSIAALFIASFLAPAIYAGAASLLRLPSPFFTATMWFHWAPAGVAFALACGAVLRGATWAWLYLTTYLVLWTVLIVPRLFVLASNGRQPAPEREERTPQSPDLTAGRGAAASVRERSGEGCCESRLVLQGGDQVPQFKSGSSGSVGWVFMVANYYTWNLSIRAYAFDDGVFAMAVAAGTFSGAFDFTVQPKSATARVTGIVDCRERNGRCLPFAAVGQSAPQSSGDFRAAVDIDVLPSSFPDQIVLEVQMVAAISGQLAIQQVSVSGTAGASGGGLRGSLTGRTTINIPNGAQDILDGTREYVYRCVPCAATGTGGGDSGASSGSGNSSGSAAAGHSGAGSSVTGTAVEEGAGGGDGCDVNVIFESNVDGSSAAIGATGEITGKVIVTGPDGVDREREIRPIHFEVEANGDVDINGGDVIVFDDTLPDTCEDTFHAKVVCHVTLIAGGHKIVDNDFEDEGDFECTRSGSAGTLLVDVDEGNSLRMQLEFKVTGYCEAEAE